MNHELKPTITVAIPTCFGGESLVQTVRSINASKGDYVIQLLISADRTPLSGKVSRQLAALGAAVMWNDKAGSQFKKLKQLIEAATGEIFIFTQDDITFDANTIQTIVTAFDQNKTLTMAGSRVLPLSPKTLVEKNLASMLRMVDTCAGYWNSGENYLAASGRCLSFRTQFLKQFRIPPEVVNGDMFLYLENKHLGGIFKRIHDSIVYIRCPQTLEDQVGPSSRFQYSSSEMASYFSHKVRQEYSIPVPALGKAILKEALRHPLSVSLYTLVFLYTRLRKQPPSLVINPLWNVDTSTKR